MKSIVLIISLAIWGAPVCLWAQTEVDAQRFSETGTPGTARAVGMGGAMNAVGADFGSATCNPAGMGLYERSEIMLSPALQFFSSEARMYGGTGRATKTNLSFANLGLAIHVRPQNKSGLVGFTFGFGLNQIEQYQRRVSVTGFSPSLSITRTFADMANGEKMADLNARKDQINPTDLTGMAFNTYNRDQDAWGNPVDVGIINPATDTLGGDWDGRYIGAFHHGQINQNLNLDERGRMNQWLFSFAGNVDDQIYFGLTLGILDLNYEQNKTITETDARNTYKQTRREYQRDTFAAKSVAFNEYFQTSGVGVNLMLGVIYQPTDFFRVGLSLQTPSAVSIEDRYRASMRIESKSGSQASTNSDEAIYNYGIRLPYKLSLGAMFQIEKKAIISADFDLTDYKFTNFYATAGDGDTDYLNNINNIISNNFAVGYNFRLGGEYRVSPMYIRAGYAYFSNVWETSTAMAPDGIFKHTFCGGVGFHLKSFFMDFAVAHQIRKDRALLYLIGDYDAPVVNTTRSFTNFIISMGFRFGKK